jgi:hypothetical protein
VALNEPSTYCSKSSSVEAFIFKGLQVFRFSTKRVEIHCIVAFSGKVVSDSHGLNEP